MKTQSSLLCLLLMLAGGTQAADPTPAPAPAAPVANVESFTPEGYTRGVRQVQVRFAQDMIALGDPRLPDPFVVACDAPGHGRWADTRNWEYDFDADLDGGVRCRFTLRPKLKSLAGSPLTGQRRFEFNTGGPAIRDALPADGWEELSEDQVFILKLDAVATTASVGEHAWCAIDGVVERVPVQVIDGAERTAILAQSRLLAYSYYQLLWKDGRISDARVQNHELTRRETLLTLLRCQRRLPPATRVTLHWGAGITTLSGLATHADQQLAFRVRPEFTATVECTRTNPRAGCVPTLPIEVTFSAPVPRASARRRWPGVHAGGRGAGGCAHGPGRELQRPVPREPSAVGAAAGRSGG
jgi:alpha-2-macroglobulin